MSMPLGYRETLKVSDGYCIQRSGRFLIVELLQPWLVLSTSRKNGGQCEHIRYLINHQTCEGNAHTDRHARIHEMGPVGYHDSTCAEAGVQPDRSVLMGTAANMNYASIFEHRFDGISVVAVVTAGVQGNATCASDPTVWHEGDDGFEKVAPYGGTINTIVLIDRSLAPAAMAHAATIIAEAKSAALYRLAVRSRYSPEFATGTSTDQYCVASQRDSPRLLTSAGTGTRLGELIGLAVRDATLEALRWQNGLEPSFARSIFHALGGHGLSENSFIDDIAPFLSESQLSLLKANREAVVCEPLVAAAAYAMATLLDRMRHGILPQQAARESLRLHAASMAAGLAAQPDRWPELYRALGEFDLEKPAYLVLKAIALGWAAKWS